MHLRMTTRLAFALIALLPLARAAGEPTTNWPQFRGTAASGVAENAKTPTKWDAEKGENILWKAETPGLGLSSPIVWGDRIFLTTAVRTKGEQPLRVGLYGDIEPVKDDSQFQWQVLCYDLKTGKQLWAKTAFEGTPQIKRHTKASHANCTPATDGSRVVAFFGSEGMYCYDMAGTLLWKRDLGTLDSGYYEVPDAQWGFASSPIIHGDKILVQCDVQKGSFVAALNIEDGTDVWMTPRKEVPTWSTPAVYKDQVILNGYRHIGAYDLNSGEEVWKMHGGGDIPVPTPIVAHDLIYITNGHGFENPVYAFKPTAKGKLKLKRDEHSSEHIAFRLPGKGTYMQTPIIVGERLYLCKDNGVMSCCDAKTGKQIFQARLGKGLTGFTASPVCAGDKLYFTSEDGDVYVVQDGPEFKLLGKNSIGEPSMATPAISGNTLLIRGQKHLFAIGEKK